jgi:hypothetical protein
MGGDISDGAKIGIGLVLLCAIVAIVLQLLKMIKNQANSGSTSLQDSFDKVSASEFDGYDQVEKTGADVKAAVKIFENRAVAVVISTLDSGSTGYSYGVHLLGQTKVTTNLKGRGDMYTVAVETTAGSAAVSAKLTPYSNHTGYISELVMDSTGVYTYNNNFAPMDKQGTDTFVRSSGRFQSELIRNDSGDIIGVYFKQTK